MRDEEEQSVKEAKRVEKRVRGEAGRSAKEQVRKKAYLAREQAVEKTWKAKETKRAEKRATEETEQSSRDQARRRALFTREQTIAQAQEARKLKAQKQPPE